MNERSWRKKWSFHVEYEESTKKDDEQIKNKRVWFRFDGCRCACNFRLCWLNRSHFDMLLFFFVSFYMCFFQMMYAVMICIKRIHPRETLTTHTIVHSIWCWIPVPNASESNIFVLHACALFIVRCLFFASFRSALAYLLCFSIVSSRSSICIIALHFRNCNRFSFDDIQCIIYTSTIEWRNQHTYWRHIRYSKRHIRYSKRYHFLLAQGE